MPPWRRPAAGSWCCARSRPPQFEHYYFTLEAAVGGLSIALAPWHLVIDDIQTGRLIALFGFRDSTYRYVAQRRTAGGDKLAWCCAWLQAQAHATPRPD